MAATITITVYTAECEKQAKTLSTEARVAIAREAAAQIQSRAPVLTGHFRDSVGVEIDGQRVAVVDTDAGAQWIEYGNSHQPAHATMVQVLSQYGKYSGMRPRGGR